MDRTRHASPANHDALRILCGTVFLMTCLVRPADAQAGDGQLKLAAVEPTVLFAREGDRLVRVFDVRMENDGEPVEASLEIESGGVNQSLSLGQVKKGKSKSQVSLPDTREAITATFTLKSGGSVADTRRLDVTPARHWTVYFVPITHHDLGYTDTIEKVLNSYDGFYDDILRFCNETSEFPEEARYRYTIEGTWSLQHFAATRPQEVVDKLGAYFKEGRIEIGALIGNEIDSLCGHEQQIRLMYPSFRFKRQYGGEISAGSITDVPGLSWGLPTVLAGGGVKYFFAGLPTYFEWGRKDVHTFWDEAAILRHGRPDAFRWEGPDGQRVLVYYQGSYGFFKSTAGPNSYDAVMADLPDMLAEMENQGSPFDLMRYIHNGLDNYPPSVKISHIARQWNEKWAFPRLIVATNSMFFAALEKQCQDVRTFRGELPHTDYVVGAISTAKETTLNRLTHDRLLSAEKAATIAAMTGKSRYPADRISQAYDNMLLYDEHTWGKAYPTGEAQDWAWNEKSMYASKAAGLAQNVLTDSLDEITGRIKLEKRQRRIVIFNPLAIERTDVARVTRFREAKPFDLIDEATGEKVAYQIVELSGPLVPAPYAAQRWARGQFEKAELYDLVFVADKVPSLGYKTYRIEPRKDQPRFEAGIRAGKNSIENRFFKVTVDPGTGAIASIYDKDLARELVDSQAAHKVNQLVVKWVQTGKQESPIATETRVGQEGPVCVSLVATAAGVGCPQVAQEVVLYEGIKRIDLFNRVLKDSTPLQEVYFAFPFKVDEPKFRFEGSNSVIEPFKDQFPGSNTNYYTVQHWANVSNESIGVTLSAVESHLLEFGGLWPCYVSQAHHGVTPPGFGQEFVKPEQLVNGHMYAFVMDSNFRTNFQPVQQADILFRYSLATHGGPQANSAHRDFGWSVHNPFIAVVSKGGQQGPLSPQMSFCRLDVPNVFLLTMKRAEDSRGVIVRLIETDGRKTDVTLALPHMKLEKAWRTNLVEEDEKELPCEEQSVTIPMGPFGIATLRLQPRS